MRKSDKKLDNQIREALTQLCEQELKSHLGFEWLSHQANYSNFPASLKVVLVFNNNENLLAFTNSPARDKVAKQISNALGKLVKKLPPSSRFLIFDSEQQCELQHKGNWRARLA